MENSWTTIFDVAASLFFFALATQCVLAWLYSLLFLSFLRAAGEPPYFRSWTLAWWARAVALTAILARFALPIVRGEQPAILDGTLASHAGYSIYQGGKLLAYWWLCEGVLRFADRMPRWRTSWIPWLLALSAPLAVIASESVAGLLLVQSPVAVSTSLLGALALLRLAPERRNAGTRITATALLVQAALWSLYCFVYLDADRGPWPVVRTPSSIIAAHNSYFDLVLDVLLASGLVVLLLQDVHRRQMAAEAERTRLRAELDRTQRLGSLGTLVSGVAHELNNPLTAILGFAEALTAPVSEQERARQANIIREQALRCRRIVHGLSTFSGKESEVHETIDLGALLERVTRGFELELARKGVRVSIEVSGAPPRFQGDRFALEQMVANLLANAVQASAPGTAVTLSARPVEQGGVELCVEDEGTGIPADVLPRIFDPFFTTRVPGEGMGLGLAVVHGIVQAHGGTIRAENRAARGARFVVTLPARLRPEAAGAQPRGAAAPRAAAAAGPLELLVIEDEPLVREMIATLGARRGWRVTAVASGRAGLERLRTEGERFDAVLCDLRMAAPSGIELHDQLASDDPSLVERFLFFTGDVGSEDAAAFARRCARPILRKPFHIDELARHIEEIAAARAVATG
jgi:signal transduction histidine kinase/ActR/RegA family two-component response regulator